MAWIRKDDKWRKHEKFLHAIHLAGGGRVGRQVKWLWDEALSESCEHGLDGIIPAYRLPLIVEEAGLTPALGAKFTPALIGSGLWHTNKTVGECDDCVDFLAKRNETLKPGAVLIHDIEDYQQLRRNTATPELKLKELQHLAMKRDTRLRELVYARDRGMCRYCGLRCTTNPHDHRSPTRLTHDHRDPHAGLTDEDRGNNLDNVVLACASCNEAKGERTPAEADMTLWSPGSTAHDIANGLATPAEPELDRELVGGSGRVDTGSGSGRSGVGPGSGQGRDGSTARPPGRTKGKGSRRAGGRTTPPKSRPP